LYSFSHLCTDTPAHSDPYYNADSATNVIANACPDPKLTCTNCCSDDCSYSDPDHVPNKWYM
jgi:hypothetical protein